MQQENQEHPKGAEAGLEAEADDVDAAREDVRETAPPYAEPPLGGGEPSRAEPAREGGVLPELEEIDMAEALAQHEREQAAREGRPPRPDQPRERGRGRERGRQGGEARGHDRRERERGGEQPARGERDDRDRRAEGDRGFRGGDRRRPESAGKPPHGVERRKPIKREILANTSFEETRVGILEDGRLVELLWERRSAQNIVGNIYKGVVENVLPGISSAFVNIGFEKNAYLYISDVLGDSHQSIDQTLKKGQHITVQVAKEAIGTKGMKVTMDVSLPGRYLVFTPYQDYVGISKHIVDPNERKRLSSIVDRLVKDVLGGKGIVVRTEAEGATEVELEREVQYLAATWKEVEKRYEALPPPALLHKDLDLALQVARDLLSDQVYVYLLDDKTVYQNVLTFIDRLSPELKERVRLYEAKTPIFTAFNLEHEIEKLRQTKVTLPSGGTIIVQEAESLCAIDVNTGRFTGNKSQEETVTMTNIEAAYEIAHQLRLRNIGGIVVIDFIDMKKASNRARVMEALADAVRRDRAKIRILPITRLGLIEMTRERKRESTVSLMTDGCPECHGSGRVLSAESLRIRIQREIHELTQGRPGGNVRLLLHPQLAEVFVEKQGLIEKNVHRAIKIGADPLLKWEDYRIILE
ncbi:MAG: Rne/Rng family ribonuclease [Elusimicrobia bacterium]|nr:Rne/Rng family ribonuclease [Elusimicrobiota bacterium]